MDRLLPADRRSRFNDSECAPLDASIVDGENLGFYCRLKLARTQASFRSRSPCTVRATAGNPDWDETLSNQVFLRTIYGSLAWPSLPNPEPEVLPESYGVNQGPFRKTSIFERQFRFKNDGGNSSEATFQMFYCLAGSPRRFVPYYMALRVDGELRSQLPLVTPPMANEGILNQLVPGFEPEYVKSFSLVDLDESGTKDILVLSDHVDNGYSVSACLYQIGALSCKTIGPSKPINPERAAAARLIALPHGQVRLNLMDENNREIGRVLYKIKGDKLELMKKDGKF